VTEPHPHPVDDLAAYTLGSLEDLERTRVETHLASCATCASKVREYRGVIGVLPAGLAPASPPPEAWTAIQAAAQAPRQARPRRLRWPRLAWPALAAVAASLLIWNVVLQRELTRYASGPQVEALARRPGRMVILTEGKKPGGSARLFVAADGGHGHLAVAGLRPLPPARTYQLWFVRPNAPAVTGGTFTVDARGRAWATIDVPVSLEETRTVTVTEEPAPGSAAPSGRQVLGADSWR
jgi:anti-sigma factor RsiW